MHIRSANKKDTKGIKLVKESLTNEIYQRRLRWQEEGKAIWLVAENDRQLVGFVLLKWFGKPTAPDYPDLEDLYIHPDYRGQGIAKLLVKAAERLVKQRGGKFIGLAVNPDSRCPANKLYRKLGYQEVDGKRYVDGVYGGVKDWVVDMVKELKP